MDWIKFRDSAGRLLEVHPADLARVIEIDPDTRVLPPADPNEFVLSAEDELFLWEAMIARE
jgi:hypothetical protein